LPKNDFYFTPFTRLKMLWLKAASAAAHERSLSKLVWTVDKTAFEYSRPGLPAVEIKLATLRNLVHDNLTNLINRFNNLLPSTYPISVVDQLPWHTLRDDASQRGSFLDSAEVWDEWMYPAVLKLKDAYLSPSETRHRIMVAGKPSRDAMDKLLSLDEDFQQSLIVDILCNTGVAPRAITVTEFLYRGTAEEDRHLYLLDRQVVLYGGRQKGQSRRDGYREHMLRAFCHMVGRCVCQYFGLFRQAIVAILRENRWHGDMIDAYETRLLATKRKHHGLINVSDVTTAWHVASESFLGTKLSIVDKRQIDTGIHIKLFPDLLKVSDNPSKTPVDGQGDHGPSVTRNRYGRDSNLCCGLSSPEQDDYIRTSNVHQALMQTAPVNRNWPANISEAEVFYRGQREEEANDLADILVPKFYSFNKLTSQEIQKKVQDICSGLPFLLCKDVCLVNLLLWRDIN
jgi:hypothetical protein